MISRKESDGPACEDLSLSTELEYFSLYLSCKARLRVPQLSSQSPSLIPNIFGMKQKGSGFRI